MLDTEAATKARIREKLRKLMAMTTENGASETEALNAAQTAARLMAEHNLTFRSVAEIEAEDYCDDARPWFRGAVDGRSFRSAPVPRVRTCLNAISSLCGVRYHYRTFDGVLVFFGAPSDTEVAHYLTVIISRAMDREWELYRQRLSVD